MSSKSKRNWPKDPETLAQTEPGMIVIIKVAIQVGQHKRTDKFVTARKATKREDGGWHVDNSQSGMTLYNATDAVLESFRPQSALPRWGDAYGAVCVDPLQLRGDGDGE